MACLEEKVAWNGTRPNKGNYEWTIRTLDAHRRNAHKYGRGCVSFRVACYWEHPAAAEF
jgi:hypothetical protein